MSLDLNALATWTYEPGVLTNLDTSFVLSFDILVNRDLHDILSAPHWDLKAQFKYDYSQAGENDWTERKIKWSKADKDPPEVDVEQEIKKGDYVTYAVIELEDSPDYSADLQKMADILNDGHSNGFTKAHTRQLMKKMVHLLQTAGVIG